MFHAPVFLCKIMELKFICPMYEVTEACTCIRMAYIMEDTMPDTSVGNLSHEYYTKGAAEARGTINLDTGMA